jgi:hypothetical protein
VKGILAGCFCNEEYGRLNPMHNRHFGLSSLAILLLAFIVSAQRSEAAEEEETRIWTSRDAKHTTEAAYLRYGRGKVELKKSDGKSVEVPVGQLSDEDQDYVRQVAEDDPACIQALHERKVELERDQEGRVTGASFPRSGRIYRRDMELLSDLPNLQKLSLVQARFGSGALDEVDNLWGLKQLDLTATGIGNPEVKTITALTGLEVLNLSDNQITNRALSYLKDLPKLTELTLANTRIADNGIANLEELKQLKKLNLSNTRVSPQGVLRLRKALPNTNMEGSGVVRR